MQDNENNVEELNLENATLDEVTQYAEKTINRPITDIPEIVKKTSGAEKVANAIAEVLEPAGKGIMRTAEERSKRINDLLTKQTELDAEDDKYLYEIEKDTQKGISSILNNSAITQEERNASADKYIEFYKIVENTHKETKEERANTVRMAIDEENRQKHQDMLTSLAILGVFAVAKSVDWSAVMRKITQK